MPFLISLILSSNSRPSLPPRNIYTIWISCNPAKPPIQWQNPMDQSASFPTTWKLVHCVDILQPSKASYTMAKSYRLICLLSYLSKVFEWIAANYIIQATINYLAILLTQMGIRRYYTAIHTLLKMLSSISPDLSKKKTTGQ
jgi:hypothetical protein